MSPTPGRCRGGEALRSVPQRHGRLGRHRAGQVPAVDGSGGARRGRGLTGDCTGFTSEQVVTAPGTTLATFATGATSFVDGDATWFALPGHSRSYQFTYPMGYGPGAEGATTALTLQWEVRNTSFSYREAVLTDEPVGYWRLGETSGSTAADETGANPGTYENGPALGLPGAINGDTDRRLGLDGVDDDVRIPGSASLDVRHQLTFEAWMKYASGDGIGPILEYSGRRTPAWPQARSRRMSGTTSCSPPTETPSRCTSTQSRC
jgi:hypothetical protein